MITSIAVLFLCFSIAIGLFIGFLGEKKHALNERHRKIIEPMQTYLQLQHEAYEKEYEKRKNERN